MISEAFANSSMTTNNNPGSLIPFLLVFAVFYFLLIRPQQKKMKEHDNTVKNLKVGDKVLTGGGIVGKITGINKDANIVTLEISKNVEVNVLSHTITNVLKDEKIDKKDKNEKNKKKK